MTKDELKKLISEAYEDRKKLEHADYQAAVRACITQLDTGKIRVAEKTSAANASESTWVVNDWVKKGILLYFGITPSEAMLNSPFEYFDKVPVKKLAQLQGVRVVPGAVVRRGSFVESGAILMPSFINIGGYVGAGTMVDTWATVGSCAQVGKFVHLSGGVGLGGVLEPPQAAPVIIEDHAFIGSRAIIVEGVRIGEGAVIGANVVITGSTKIYDVSQSQTVEYVGVIPPRSVVIPGVREKQFPGGKMGVPCALIIGKRRQSTDEKVSLNDALREFQVLA